MNPPDLEIKHRVSITWHHRVTFTHKVFNSENPVLSRVIREDDSGRRSRLFFAVDQGLHQANPGILSQIEAYCEHHREVLDLTQAPFLVPGGEAAKNQQGLFEALVEKIHDSQICRHSYVVGVGGGSVLDLVGFAAAVVHRGVRLIRIPTTVLAQNDAGIGIKNGVNRFGKKNFLGTFDVPHAVLNDFSFLETLGLAQWREGTAEAVKVALLRDSGLFSWIQDNAKAISDRNMELMEVLIQRCASLHLQQIAHGGDPFEKGSARPLDFGHWAAHKMEQLSGFQMSHGHAVAVGIAIDSLYSHRLGLLSEEEWVRIRRVLDDLQFRFDLGPVLGLRTPADTDRLLVGLEDFREHLGGQLSITLLKGIGDSTEVHSMKSDLLRECIAQVLHLD